LRGYFKKKVITEIISVTVHLWVIYGERCSVSNWGESYALYPPTFINGRLRGSYFFRGKHLLANMNAFGFKRFIQGSIELDRDYYERVEERYVRIRKGQKLFGKLDS